MSNKPNQNDQKDQKELKELDVQTRPNPLTDEVVVAEENRAVLLLKQLLEEANQISRAVDIFAPKTEAAYRRLHAAFRHLMSLRGEDFTRGFALFQEAARAGRPNGIFHPYMANQKLEFFQDAAERETFVIFMPLVTRYALAQDGQKAKFAQNNNVERLLSRIVDEELAGLLAEAFGAK